MLGILLVAGLAAAEEPTLTLSVRGAGPWVGHASSVALRSSEPVEHAGSGRVRITGPGMDLEIPVSLAPPPPRSLPACDPVPEDPHSCDDQPDFEPQGQFTGTSVATPPWPRAGTYTVAFQGRQAVEPVEIEVVDHPLAHLALLPSGYTETIRATDRFKRRVGDEPVFADALIVAGERGASELWVRVTESLGDRCPDVLAAVGEQRSWEGSGRTAYQVYAGLPRSWSWCSEGRLIELRPRALSPGDRRRLLARMFRVAASDGAPVGGVPLEDGG